MAVMTGRITPAPCPFTPQEREYIRRELDMFFGTLPSVAEGFQLRTWRGGPLAGQPKVPPAVRTMVERGLVEIRTDTRVPKVHFSEAGLAALRLLALDRRYMDPQKFAHVRAELGLERQSNGQSARHTSCPGGRDRHVGWATRFCSMRSLGARLSRSSRIPQVRQLLNVAHQTVEFPLSISLWCVAAVRSHTARSRRAGSSAPHKLVAPRQISRSW